MKTMTREQAVWAAHHNWFVFADHNGLGGWTVTVRGDVSEPETMVFGDYQALRIWAGY